jgi:hypothetical protein
MSKNLAWYSFEGLPPSEAYLAVFFQSDGTYEYFLTNSLEDFYTLGGKISCLAGDNPLEVVVQSVIPLRVYDFLNSETEKNRLSSLTMLYDPQKNISQFKRFTKALINYLEHRFLL